MMCFKYGTRIMFKLLIALIATGKESMAESGLPSHQDQPQRNWAMVAYHDLVFMRQAIDAAHPAVLDKDDVEFHAWREEGYVQAQALAARASNERQATAAVRFYAVGFKDGHLVVAPNPARRARNAWAGWIMQERNGEYFVAERANHWPIALPPVGARILECDDRAVSTLVREEIMPFTDRRVSLVGVRRSLASHVTVETSFQPFWREPVQSCLAELPDGQRQRFPMLWREEDEGLRRAFATRRYPLGLHDMGGGTYWVNVSNFQLGQAGLAQLERLLAQLRRLDAAKMVILDTRGNQGGNSAFGERILRALFKQAMPPDDEQTTAWWRVSKIAIDNLRAHVDRYRALEGDTGPDAHTLAQLLEQMLAAHGRGASWLRDEYVPEVAEQVEHRGSPFQGRVALITDAHCASACLDFADAVLRIPGAVHLGESTSADTDYLDVTLLPMPSGLTMVLPLKVYRGRARRSNEALVPHFVYGGDMDDTASLQQWVLEKMRSDSLK